MGFVQKHILFGIGYLKGMHRVSFSAILEDGLNALPRLLDVVRKCEHQVEFLSFEASSDNRHALSAVIRLAPVVHYGPLVDRLEAICLLDGRGTEFKVKEITTETRE